MDLCILGPVEVRHEGRVLCLGGTRQRALLAVLVLRADEVSSVGRLIDDLWGEEPPPTAAHALRVHVCALRKALRAAGDGRERLLTRPPGYVLAAEPKEVDLRRFEHLVAEGRRASAEGDPASSAAALAEALTLWRGPAFADLASAPFAVREAPHLEELRLAALEDRIDADLALGRHDSLIGEIRALVDEYPFRERLRGQLMVALYRSGRQVEALAVYRAARMFLAEEFGIDPSPGLQELETAILRQDVSSVSG